MSLAIEFACVYTRLSTMLLHKGRFCIAVADELEVGTGGKVVVVARESGKLDCYNLLTKSMMSSLQYNSALNACISINSNILVAGSQNGAVLVFDRRHPW